MKRTLSFVLALVFLIGLMPVRAFAVEAEHTHAYTPTVTAPTCIEKGYTTYTCACGDSYVDDVSMDITDRFKWNEGYVISAVNGNMMADKNWVASDYVDISAFDSIEIVTGDTVNANTTLGIAFYDATHKYVSGVVHTDKTGTEYGILVHNLEVPQGVVYLRTTWYSVNHGSYNGATVHTFYCKGTGTAVPPLGHSYVLTGETKPNCSAGGSKTYTCSRCGEVSKETTAKGNHAYENGTCIGCGSSVLGNDWIVPSFAEGDYSMVVLPDTQNMVDHWPEFYYAQMQWITDNKDSMNIQAVLHMGDMVNTNNDAQWTVCETGTDILENAGIPWMPMRGNHDDSAWFNKYYDYTTYGSSQSWFGGSYQTGKLDHTYWFVTVGGREYMILSLGWAPSWDVLNWAHGIVEQYSGKNVILACHAYMNDDGTLLSKGDAHCVSSSLPNYPNGDDVWAAFKGYENVILAMGGHIHSADIVTFEDANATGRNVTSLLIDRQNDEIASALGMVAVLTFRTDCDTVEINWYSTRYDALYREKNQFSVTVPHVCDHQYTSAITEAACTVGGGTRYTCTICGYSYVDAVSPPLGHDYDAVVTAPSCMTAGYTTLTCSVCGHSERKETTVDITDQLVWTEGYRITATNGQQVADNNWVASDYLDISDYLRIEIKTANTASKDSNAGLAFYDANKNYISGVIHTDKSGIYGTLIRNLEIPENAVYVRTTWYSRNHAAYAPAFGEAYCKATTTVIPALEHEYTTVNVAPTCTTPGYIAEVCSVCGHSERKTTVIDITDQFEWTDDRMIIATTGICTAEYTNWQASDYLDISAYQSIEIKTANTASKDSNAGLAFYDANKNYISGVIHTDKSGVYGTLIQNLEIPENAVYVRTTWYSKDHVGYDPAFGEVYCKATTMEIPATGHAYENGVCTACSHTIGPVITQQPTDVTANLGERFKITVAAEGNGLTYQWYYSNNGGKSFAVSSFKTCDYSMTMASYCHNRQIYCVITDANGNSVQTETVTITTPLTITKQPVGVHAEIGQKFSISVDALGDGLCYQWYYKNSGSRNFAVSSFNGKSYSMTMADYCHNRQVYCVITDQYGNSVQSETVTISLPPVALTIVTQPQDVQVEIGEKVRITVEATGDSLTYQWYYKDNGSKEFRVSSYQGSSYSMTMASYCHGRQVYCVITDAYGNTVITDIATMTRPPAELMILTQPTDVSAAVGEKFSIAFTVQGDGLNYQWYYKDKGSKTFKPSAYTSGSYAMTTASYMDGRQVYCVITDQFGNQVTTDAATIHVEK